MANKRIPTSALSAIPTQQGQVLKGEHLAILRGVLSEGVNANKHDIDRIIAGDVDAYMYYDTPTNSGLSYLEALTEVDINTEGFVVSYKDIQYYLYTGSSWEFQASLSLVDLFRKVQVLETAAGFDTSFVDDFTLMLQNMQNQIDNIVSGVTKSSVLVFESMEEANSAEVLDDSYAFVAT